MVAQPTLNTTNYFSLLISFSLNWSFLFNNELSLTCTARGDPSRPYQNNKIYPKTEDVEPGELQERQR